MTPETKSAPARQAGDAQMITGERDRHDSTDRVRHQSGSPSVAAHRVEWLSVDRVGEWCSCALCMASVVTA